MDHTQFFISSRVIISAMLYFSLCLLSFPPGALEDVLFPSLFHLRFLSLILIKMKKRMRLRLWVFCVMQA